MVLRLRPNADWAAPSGHAKALAQGLWAGAAAIAALTFMGYAGDAGLLLAILVTAVLPGALVPLSAVDILRTRQATVPALSAAIVAAALVSVAWLTAGFLLPSGLPTPTLDTDEEEAAVPALVGLLMGAERLAAHGRLAWRDRALGAAAGHAIVGGVFLLQVAWLSWAVLLALLPLRLPAQARVALAVLSGAAALGLGQHFDGVWTARLAEAAAFVAHAAISLALAKVRPARPARPQTARAPPLAQRA